MNIGIRKRASILILMAIMFGMVIATALVFFGQANHSKSLPAHKSSVSLRAANDASASRNNAGAMGLFISVVLVLACAGGDVGFAFWARKEIKQICGARLTPQMKLDQIKNADILFDLPLYLGLSGTVIGFLLIAWGFPDGSRTVAYLSTVFGIIVSALMRLLMLRLTRKRLLELCARRLARSKGRMSSLSDRQ